MVKSKKREKNIFIVSVFLFAIGFMCLCQHMSVIKLGYKLGKEKETFKELSNINRSLYLTKASLKSPRYLNNVACSNLGLNIGAEVKFRKISMVTPQKKMEDGNKIVKGLNRFFGFNSKALAKPTKNKN